MSYVLEALKKSQSQREQGAVPGIHSLQIPYQAMQDKPRATHKPLLWAIAVLLLVIAALLVWRMGPPAPATPKPVSLPVPRVVQPAPGPVATVAEPVPAPAAAPVAQSLPAAEVQVPGSHKEDATAAKKKERPSRKEAAKPPAVEARVYLVSELPEPIRRELPSLVISGGSYSSNPAQRLIIVNNQVFTEGSQPAAGVVVQRIEPSAAVLSFQGYWYRLGY